MLIFPLTVCGGPQGESELLVGSIGTPATWGEKAEMCRMGSIQNIREPCNNHLRLRVCK